jgi:iron(III) transport system substrate-binding protein
MERFLFGLRVALLTLTAFLPTFASAQTDARQLEWEKVLQAAKKEGKVVVMGPPGARVRRVLTEALEKTHPDIKVEFQGGQGGELAAKLIREREGDLYTTDVWIGGFGTLLSLLKPKGVLDPTEPALIVPEVADPKNWRDYKLEFADKDGKYALVFVNQSGSLFVYNTDLVKLGEVPQSLQDLLNPKWTGKMIAVDPTTGGPGRATFTWIYKEIGTEFLQALGKQKLVFTRDRRDLVEEVARGAFPLGLAVSNLDAQPFIAAKAPIKLVWNLKEGSFASASYGGVALVNRAPHPNAAKVYINWLLGKEAQTVLAQAAGWVSRRKDVPPGDPEAVLKPGVKYFKVYLEDNTFIYRTEGYRRVMKEAFGLGR